MKKLKLTKVIASSLIVASVMVLNPIGANAEWRQDSNGSWNTAGSSWTVGWTNINQKWYYFGQDGYMVHDKTIEGYKLGSDGTLVNMHETILTNTQSTTSTATQSTDTSKDNIVDVTVGNAQEFVNAIGSNKRILLKPGVYNLSDIQQIDKADNSVVWRTVSDGKELDIQNIHNLTIEGIELGTVEIKAAPRYAEIMNFSNVNNITIKNIIAGHTPEPYRCNAGVLGFKNSNDISIMNSELYGCGSIGLCLDNVKRLETSNCIIDHCSLRAIDIYNSEAIKFTENKIINHEAYSNIIYINGSKDIIFEKCELADNNNFDWSFIEASTNSNVLFDKCVIKNNSKAVGSDFNAGKTYFFTTYNKSKITIKDSEISGNKCDYLLDDKESVELENCTMNNNAWK